MIYNSDLIAFMEKKIPASRADTYETLPAHHENYPGGWVIKSIPALL